MFDLTKALVEWREQLQQGGQCQPDDIQELEEHLIEEMSTLENQGLSSEEAFLVSVCRLGAVDRLKLEFGKVNRKSVWLSRFRWMALGVIVGLFSLKLSQVISYGSVLVLLPIGLEEPSLAIVGVVLKLVILVTMMFLIHEIATMPSFEQWFHTEMRNRKTRIRLIWYGGICSLALPVCHLTFQALIVKQVSRVDYTRLVIVSDVASLVISVVLPVLLLIWIMRGITNSRRITQ